jgi:hypothetical protein
MTRTDLEEVWARPGVKCWGHLTCWDDFGVASPGMAMVPTCGEDAMEFRRKIKIINAQVLAARRKERAR